MVDRETEESVEMSKGAAMNGSLGVFDCAQLSKIRIKLTTALLTADPAMSISTLLSNLRSLAISIWCPMPDTDTFPFGA
ncbi:hypothetical protein CJ014_00925 [Pleomorphomonas carboxyditropha]|uniref:Uncharacterized protein n=1 Tax=Pleomorphomonas carboxyditropha TaxID=2023338 RepID=A0A2G9X148_9HYPH|nr:hypothetical protein CJ014_00925 [Pleomorphomonas carboxyditropha]